MGHSGLDLPPSPPGLAFQELPTARAFVGGALVMGAVIFDIIGSGQMRAPRAPSSELAP